MVSAQSFLDGNRNSTLLLGILLFKLCNVPVGCIDHSPKRVVFESYDGHIQCRA